MCVVNTPGFYGATITYPTPEYAYYRQSGEKYWLVNFVTGTLYNYACADATGLTAVTTMKENH